MQKEYIMLDFVQIGKRIQDCRHVAGLTQQDLGEKTELSPPHISRIENGSKKLSLESLVAIASVLHVSTDYLLFGKPDCQSPLNELIKDLPYKEQLRIYNALATLKTNTRNI
jgi:transcriptional regulator with XRE-family HTH domain